MMARNKTKDTAPRVHDELKGFQIQISEFGEINASMGIERLNQFLNARLDDKKLKGRATEAVTIG